MAIATIGGTYQSWLRERSRSLSRAKLLSSEQTDTDDKVTPPSFYLQRIPALFVSIFLASLFLIPLHSLALASVRFSGVTDADAKLLTHSQGYWYVIERGDRSVKALPDNSAGTGTIVNPCGRRHRQDAAGLDDGTVEFDVGGRTYYLRNRLEEQDAQRVVDELRSRIGNTTL